MPDLGWMEVQQHPGIVPTADRTWSSPRRYRRAGPPPCEDNVARTQGSASTRVRNTPGRQPVVSASASRIRANPNTRSIGVTIATTPRAPACRPEQRAASDSFHRQRRCTPRLRNPPDWVKERRRLGGWRRPRAGLRGVLGLRQGHGSVGPDHGGPFAHTPPRDESLEDVRVGCCEGFGRGGRISSKQ